MLRLHERVRRDRSVLGCEQRLVRVALEVVADEARARGVGRVLHEKPLVVVEELRAEREARRKRELARSARLDVVEDRADLGVLVAERREPAPAL